MAGVFADALGPNAGGYVVDSCETLEKGHGRIEWRGARARRRAVAVVPVGTKLALAQRVLVDGLLPWVIRVGIPTGFRPRRTAPTARTRRRTRPS